MKQYLSLEEAEEFVLRVVETLGEHFDAVQILATSHSDGGGTHDMFAGSGNWYARAGMAHEFLKRDEARTISKEFDIVDDDDEGEEWKSIKET